jgi:hypothetical protein
MTMDTYTNSIKQKAIYEVLADLFKGTCEYSDLIQGHWGNSIEPDINALDQFREYLNELAALIRVQDFEAIKNHLEKITIPFVRRIGLKFGHITSSYITGTWGVRYSTLDKILIIIDIDNIPDLYNRTARIYDLDVKITSVKVTSYSVWYELTPLLDPEIRPFQIDFSWKTLRDKNNNGLIINEE